MKPLKIFTSILLTVTLTALCGCHAQPSTDQSKPAQSSLTQSSSEASAGSSAVTINHLDVQKMLTQPLQHKKYTIPVTPVLQMPELPTGCESVSLSMVLNTIGYPTEKTELADSYMPMGNSFVTTFKGDPHTNTGWGIYPPGTVRMANNFIHGRQVDAAAVDLTGLPFESLYHLIENDYPIVIWTTGGLHQPIAAQGDGSTETYQGREYHWYNNIHCVVLSGFDTEKGTVVVNDPLSPEPKVYDAAQFQAVYDQTDRMAMTVVSAKS